MRKTWVVVAVICAIGAAFAVSAAALQSDDGWFRQRATGVFLHRVEGELDITNTQREQIRAILKDEQPAIKSLADRLRQEQEELNSQPAFDESWVRNFAQQHASTREDALVERQKVRAEIMQVLTPDQQKKAEQLEKTLSARLTARLIRISDQL